MPLVQPGESFHPMKSLQLGLEEKRLEISVSEVGWGAEQVLRMVRGRVLAEKGGRS